ncbi:hypothetical protein [Paenibacillus sp. AN1007]|uniref:Holin n=1 Tax=Paenibacillus sp. AN1007 TaxID=3151385 RepID=A0AAU8NL92_9BACL
MDINEWLQYFNQLTSHVGGIGDAVKLGLNDVHSSINNLNNTLSTTNLLLIVMIAVMIVNTIIKWRNKSK